MIKKLQSSLDEKGLLSKEQMDEIYNDIVKLEHEDLQGMIYMRSEVKKDLAPSWSLMGVAKKIIGVVMLIGIGKMILFPAEKDIALDEI